LLNFNHVYYFYVTATEGSIKAAAERLGVTQPTVSEQLRMLERTLGVELFERSPSGLKLTLAGRDASQYAAAMFMAGERLVRSLGANAAPSAAGLRVGVSTNVARTLSSDFLLPVLTDGTAPTIQTGDFNEIMRDLRSRDLDLVIGEAEPAELTRGSLAAELIYRPHLVAILAATVVAREDWSNLCLLKYRSSSVYQWEIEGYLQAHRLQPAVGGELDDAYLMLEAVLQSNFIAFVPRSIASVAMADGRVQVLATLALETAGVYAVYPEGDTLRLPRAIVERLVQSAASP